MPGSLNEKYEKKKSRVKKKHLARAMAQVERQIAMAPKECATCCAPFDPSAPGALDSWHCTVSTTGAALKCPECQRVSGAGVTPSDTQA
jgi:hypothetical protein